MYPSRLFLTNGIVSMELDTRSGEVLAFVREDTADNAIKNFIRPVTGILDGIIYIDGEKKHLSIPRYAQIRRDPALSPNIRVEQTESEARATIHYPFLVADGEKTAVSAFVEITLPEGDCRTRWTLTLDNPSADEIESVSFPQLSGMWLGEDWQKDILVFPRNVGEKLIDPTTTLASPQPKITWKWQEYLYSYNLGCGNAPRDERGLYSLTRNYAGGCSMLWMDLYNETENTGIYLTCRDPEMLLKGINVSTLGPASPGIGMGITHYPCLKNGKWSSGECIAAFHRGDWHWAADEYRAYRSSVDRPKLPQNALPQWFQSSVGLMAHYDFKYQSGDIVHTFQDIPALFDRMQETGLDNLFIAGWHKNGFDNGFPIYRIDESLGTEEELKAGIDYVHAKGGHVTFYVNSRLCNTAYEENAERVQKSTVMNRDGSRCIEGYGAAEIEFATLCMNEKDWREQLVSDVGHLVKDLGADGIYFDQLCSPSLLCFHPEHTEHAGNPAAWNQGYEKLLQAMHTELGGTALLSEGCCDIFGKGLSGQLISTLHRPLQSCFPEIYKYTFPQEILVDMMVPHRHSAMRAEVVARKSTFLLYRAFVLGCYFWCYDLEEDNTFERDPEQKARLMRTVALRQQWLQRYGQGTFRDQEGIQNAKDKLYKRFDIEGGILVACADEKGLKGELSVSVQAHAEKVYLLTDTAPAPVEIPFSRENDRITVDLPDTELALIVIQ